MSSVNLENIRFSRGPLEILNIAEFKLESGSHTLLTGASGTGKSTLLHLLAGFLPPTSGRYQLDDQWVESLSELAWDDIRAKKIGIVFQHYPMLRGFDLLDNILVPMGIAGRVDRELAVELLARVGLEERLHHRPSQLSAGQRQRASIVRAVIRRPGLILADEPTAHLDEDSGFRALAVLRELVGEYGATLLLVSHDKRLERDFPAHLKLEELNRAAEVATS